MPNKQKNKSIISAADAKAEVIRLQEQDTAETARRWREDQKQLKDTLDKARKKILPKAMDEIEKLILASVQNKQSEVSILLLPWMEPALLENDMVAELTTLGYLAVTTSSSTPNNPTEYYLTIKW